MQLEEPNYAVLLNTSIALMVITKQGSMYYTN